MQALFYSLEHRKKELERAISTAEKIINSAPPGKLRLTTSHGRRQYIHVLEESNGKGEYLGKNKMKQIEKLANKEYARQFLNAATKEIS